MRTDEKGRPRTQRGAQGCPPSPIKTPKHPGKKTRSGNRLSLTGQRQLWLGRWAEAPPAPPRASRARGMCPSSSAPSTRSQASGQARGNGQATITALFFQLKPNPRVHFCHPARDRSATARRSVGASGEELSSRGDGRAAGKREARSSEDEISWVR